MSSDPHVVCIFRSVRTDHSADEYEEWSGRIDRLVAAMPGYIGHASFRDDASGRGVTISHFESMSDLEAQALGQTAFYREYEVEVAEIVRHYEWKSSE